MINAKALMYCCAGRYYDENNREHDENSRVTGNRIKIIGYKNKRIAR